MTEDEVQAYLRAKSDALLVIDMELRKIHDTIRDMEENGASRHERYHLRFAESTLLAINAKLNSLEPN